jgi:glycosyltransferase involved in cell wall biosynthesis
MNILYIADPNSIHDVKWVSMLSSLGHFPLWLPRLHHQSKDRLVKHQRIVAYIADFSIVRFWRTIQTIRKIKRIVKSNDVRVIHVMYAEPNALWCCYRKYLNVPMIVTCRGTDVLKTIPQAFVKKDPLNKLVACLYKRAFLKADFVTGTSQRQLDSVRAFSGRSENMAIVRTGVDIEPYLHPAPRLRQHDQIKQPFIFFPRAMAPIYNHEFTLRAIEALPYHVRTSYRMVFVDRDSTKQSYVEQIQELMNNVNASFVFLNKQTQEEMIALYQHCSLVVMNPHSDGAPVSAMEAMICKKPVIMGPLAYDPDLFDTTYRLREWNEAELAELMGKVLAKPQGLDDRIEANYQRVLSNGNRTNEMSKIAKIYHDLLSLGNY